MANGRKIRNYRRFLKGLRDQLVQAMAEAENAGWHHMALDTPEWVCYNRIVTWCDEVDARCEWYDNVQAAHGRRNPQTINDA